MKLMNMLRSLIISLYGSLKRFPIAIGLSTMATILMMILIHNENHLSQDLQDMIGRIVMVLALGIPLSLCTKLIFERRQQISFIANASIYLVEALGLVGYYFFLLQDLNMVTVTRYVGLSLALYIAFTYIPYFPRKIGFELYVIKLLTRFFTAIIYSVILFLGIAAILFTIDKLLEIRIHDKLYFDVWLGVVGIFAPSFFLAGVPLSNEQFDASSYPKLLKVLLLYIVMPLTAVYTVILYLYFTKIIATLQWPIGIVAHLVLWYSVICAMIIFLITPLEESDKWTRKYIFLLPKVIIPLIIMLFVSMGIRVDAYGITENRYFVLALGLWALGIMIYLNIAKDRRNIVLLISLSIIACLSVVGPWSSYSVSKYSQNHRLEDILHRYDMIQDKAIVKSTKEVSDIDKKEISEILRYFSQSHTFGDVKILPKEFTLSQMKDVFGFPYVENSYNGPVSNYFSYSADMSKGPMNIAGYSYMFMPNTYNSAVTSAADKLEVKYDYEKHEVRIILNNKEIYSSSLESFGRQLYKKYGRGNQYNLSPNEMSWTDENGQIQIKFIFNYIDGYEGKTESDIDINGMDFYTLINLK